MPEIISASRRSDIPAFYLPQLIDYIRQGFAEVVNPFSGVISRVDLNPESVHTLVLWSKDYGKFLREEDAFREYSLYFLFTVNDMPDLEPWLPPLGERLDQARELAQRYGPERIGWRFDPVAFRAEGPVSPVETYSRIGAVMARHGIRRSIFSFLDLYGKVKARNTRYNLGLTDPSGEVKREYASRLAVSARERGLSLESCCEELAGIEGISPSACIDGNLLSRLAGKPADTRKDSGQRAACRCTRSRDIGSYSRMPCSHGCLYCYANPILDRGKMAS